MNEMYLKSLSSLQLCCHQLSQSNVKWLAGSRNPPTANFEVEGFGRGGQVVPLV